MSSQTPEPASKRRRVETANTTLRKPFKSPLINRPTTASDASTPKSSSLKPRIAASGAGGGRSAFSRQPQQHVASPLTSAARSRSRKIPGKAPLKVEFPFNPFREKLQKTQRETAARLRVVKAEMELVQQAGRIERESKAKRPGEQIDAELREVTAKWRDASRLAAEDLFELIKQRVEGMGGAKGLRKQRQEYGGFYDDGAMERGKERGSDGGSGRHDEREEREGDDIVEREGREERQKADEDAEEEVCLLMVDWEWRNTGADCGLGIHDADDAEKPQYRPRTVGVGCS